jgi:hypothetical protein
MANKSLLSIQAAADALMRKEGNSSGIPGVQEAQVVVWANDLHKAFFDEFSDAGKNGPEYMRRDYGVSSRTYTTLSNDVLSGATTFAVEDGDGLTTSGAGVIYRNQQFDIFTFSGNSSDTITGVDGIEFDHDDGEIVQSLYALPANFGRFRIEKDRGEGVRINGLGYKKVPDLPSTRQFASWQNPTTSSWYLWLPHFTGDSSDVLVTYDQKPTELTAISDLIDIPEQYRDWMYIVWGLVGIFKQVLDEDYVANRERAEQLKIVNSAFKRNSAGKRITAGNTYFKRFGI